MLHTVSNAVDPVILQCRTRHHLTLCHTLSEALTALNVVFQAMGKSCHAQPQWKGPHIWVIGSQKQDSVLFALQA